MAEDDARLAGHIGLVQGVRTQCLLEVTGREAGGLGGMGVSPKLRRYVGP